MKRRMGMGLLMVLFLLGGPGLAGAVTIYPANYSFESPVLGEWTWGAPDGWTSTLPWGPATWGSFQAPPLVWAAYPATDGVQVLYQDKDTTVYQQLPDVVQAGVSYVLKADIGDGLVSWPGAHPTYALTLCAGDPDSDMSTWTDLTSKSEKLIDTTGEYGVVNPPFYAKETPAYVGAGAAVGKRLGIKLTFLLDAVDPGYSVSGDLQWDNIRVVTDQSMVATPTFSPDGGTYGGPQTVTIVCTTPEATIRYTTNGVEPTETTGTAIAPGSTVVVASPLTLKAKAWASGYLASDLKSAEYVVLNGTIYPANYSFESPVLDAWAWGAPDGWTSTLPWGPATYGHFVPQPLFWMCYPAPDGRQTFFQDKDTIVYQLLPEAIQADMSYVLAADIGDGIIGWPGAHPTYALTLCAGDPGSDMSTWTELVSVSEKLIDTTGDDPGYGLASAPFYAKATPVYVGAGDAVGKQLGIKLTFLLDAANPTAYSYSGDLQWDNVRILTPAAAIPTFSPDGGVYSYAPAQIVTISCATSGATIRYTTDGTDPTETNGTLIPSGGTVAVDHTLTLKAKAWVAGMNSSNVKSAQYTVVYDHGTIPQAAVSIDGDLSDWPAAAEWLTPFVFWNGTGPSLDSITKAKFAWNDATNMLYVAVQTNEAIQQPGGHLVIGPSKSITGIPSSGLGATQLCFDTQSGTDVLVQNEFALYGDPTQGADGVVAQYTFNAETGFYTYEVAIPLWTNWHLGSMTTKQPLSGGDVVYVYLCMEDKLAGANGTTLSCYGNPSFYAGAFNKAAALTLAFTSADLSAVLAAMDKAQGQPGFDAQADHDGDGEITSSDLSIVLGHLE